MQTATAASPRSARDTFTAGNPSVNTAPNLDAPRFFVQMGFSVLGVDTDAIPNRYLLRGEITPLRSFPKKSNIYEIPEGARIPGSEESDPSPVAGDRRAVWARYWMRAQFEADRLNDLEATSALKQGLVEIKTLAKYPHLYEQIDFNAVFYPGGLHALPAKNEDLIALLKARLPEVVEQSPADLKPMLREIGEELIAAAEAAHKIQQSRLEFTHRCMQLSPDDKSGYYKKEYDLVDEEMLLRTGKARVGEAHEVQAKALHILAEDKAAGRKDDPFAALAKAQEEQNNILREQLRLQAEQNQQLIEMLRSQQTPAAKEAYKPEPPKAPSLKR